jgi:hypothetical protein
MLSDQRGVLPKTADFIVWARYDTNLWNAVLFDATPQSFRTAYRRKPQRHSTLNNSELPLPSDLLSDLRKSL